MKNILEWLVETENSWSLKAGSYRKGLKKKVKPELWAELEDTYVGAADENNWDDLFRTISLFRKVAIMVTDRISYSYPQELDDRVLKYLARVQKVHESSA